MAEALGYEVEIKRALWERVRSFGVPRIVGSLWFVLWLMTGFCLMVLVGLKWVLLAAGCWGLGHVVMMGLTARDPHWDDVAVAQLTRQYKAYYEAG